jgi:hypothetical protein
VPNSRLDLPDVKQFTLSTRGVKPAALDPQRRLASCAPRQGPAPLGARVAPIEHQAHVGAVTRAA